MLKFLATHGTIETSRIVIAPEPPDNRKRPGGVSDSEMGRMYFATLPDKTGADLKLELFFKHSEFEEVWNITTQQEIRKVIATLVCFKPKQDELSTPNESALVAGILSSSLQMMPNS